MHSTQIVIIIIRNKKGAYYMHQRRSDKKVFPNLYGIGAGGHIETEEDPAMAAARELYEETGLQTPVHFLFPYEYRDKTNHLLISVYETRAEDVGVSESEWQWSGWMTKEQVDALADQQKLCPDTAQIYNHYLAHQHTVDA